MDNAGTETVLHTFPGHTGGDFPNGGPVADTTGHLYGAASSGGKFAGGILFKITLPNFKITASPTSATVSPGQSTNSTLTLTPVDAFTGTVALTCTVPSGKGISCGVSPGSVVLNGANSATAILSMNTSSTTPTGTYKIKLTVQ